MITSNIAWKPIPLFEDRYEVSNTGLVRSLRYFGHIGKTGLLKPRWTNLTSKNRGKYASVRLINKIRGLDIQYRIHRLVAELFIPNPECKPEVNHIDGNTENNHYSNLEWVTSSENHKHAYNNGLISLDNARKARDDNIPTYEWIHDKKGDFTGSLMDLMVYDLDIPDTAVSLLYKVCNDDIKYQHYKSAFGWRVNWNPGSDGARIKFSCSCPVIDNGHGRGSGWGPDMFWINEQCPLHGTGHIGKT